MPKKTFYSKSVNFIFVQNHTIVYTLKYKVQSYQCHIHSKHFNKQLYGENENQKTFLMNTKDRVSECWHCCCVMTTQQFKYFGENVIALHLFPVSKWLWLFLWSQAHETSDRNKDTRPRGSGNTYCLAERRRIQASRTVNICKQMYSTHSI